MFNRNESIIMGYCDIILLDLDVEFQDGEVLLLLWLRLNC